MKARKHRPATKLELIARLHRGLRPKLDRSQLLDLALCHINNLDEIAHGRADEHIMWDWAGSVLTWSKVAELLDIGIEEMTVQLDVAAHLVERFTRTGRVGFSGPDYQLAKTGTIIMDELAKLADRPTAIAAADWSEATLQGLKDQCDLERAMGIAA